MTEDNLDTEQFFNLDKKEDEKKNAQKFYQYIVREDDTLFGIALKFNINIHTLESLNDVSESNLFPKQVFFYTNQYF